MVSKTEDVKLLRVVEQHHKDIVIIPNDRHQTSIPEHENETSQLASIQEFNVSNIVFNFKPIVEDTNDKGEVGVKLKLFKRRWLMLFLYVAYMLCNSSQWLQYSIISNIVEKYYGVSESLVNLTSLIVMICYIPLGLPAAYLMDRINLRWTAIIGCTGTCIGSWLKVMSVSPDRFFLTLAGQTVVGISQVIMLSVPQKLSSTWFGEREVSSACSIGVFGFQMGIVFGFFVPPLMVKDRINIDLIGHDFFVMFLSFACVATFIAVLVLFFFEAAPRLPPTLSEARSLGLNKVPYFPTLKRLFSDKHICALFVLTGINNGCFNGLSTLLNQIFSDYFPGQQEDAGRVGVTMVIFGMTASVIFGVILDKTKRFKLVLLGVYYMSAVAMLSLTFILLTKNLVLVYAAAAFVGTFLCGFTAVSFDVATELTYPESELIVGTIMNIMSLFFTIVWTVFFGWMNNAFGFYWGNIGFVATLCAGATCMLPIRFHLKRTSAQRYDDEKKLNF